MIDLKQTLGNIPALKKREQIPLPKRKAQWVNSLFGGLVFGAGLVAPWKLGFPWQAGVGIAAFGAFMVSKQLVVDFLKVIPQALSAIVQALSGKAPPQ